MGMYKRDTLLNDLKQHVLEVTFTKVNGEKRVMRCSLDSRYLPQHDQKHLEEMHQKQENLNVIAAWDVTAGGWRSFRIDSVEYVQIIDGY
jgi:uncharacterized cupin superfamily protein